MSQTKAHWTASVIEHRALDELVPYARNARTHSPVQIASLAGMIREFGFTTPLLITGDNSIIAGHGRVEAARMAGLERVPVIVMDHLSEAQRKALVIADNRAAELAEWDTSLLSLELEDLRLDEFDLDLTGFDAAELEGMFDAGQAPDFEPGSEDDQGKLDELAPKMIACPHCGKEFDSREQG
jgi:ParB-like chromosome segregation protein Spo0J